MQRKLVIGVAGAVALAIGLMAMVSGSATERAPVAPATSPERKALEAVLWDLKRNWKA